VALTDDVMFVERLAPDGRHPSKDGGLFDVPMDDITSVTVEEHAGAHSSRG
jgi:hypothetical protein